MSPESLQGVQAVWVDVKQDENRILISEYSGEDWTQPETVYGSENALTGPALGTDANGNKLLIWTEQLRRKTILKSIHKMAGEGWQEAEIFNEQGLENFGATIVYDLNNTGWVFWSSASGGLSEIFLSTSTGIDWSRRQQVNKSNEVPDILPVARLTAKGDVQVDWTRYSFEAQGYITDSAMFSVAPANGEPFSADEIADSIVPEDIPVPDFLPKNAVSLMHIPSNRMIQSLPIRP